MRRIVFLIFISFVSIINALEVDENLRLDGYSNVTKQLDSKDDNNIKLDGGLQGRYQVTQSISITGHIYFDEDRDTNKYEEDLKWLYADYYIGNEFTLRVGKFQFPIFTDAEIGTIGYLRTWTENPISTYGAFGYDDFIGAEVLKNFSYHNYDFLLQFSYGKSENDLPNVNKSTNSITGKANSITGVTLKTSNDWLTLNSGYIRALSTINDSSTSQNNKSDNSINFNMYALETQIDMDSLSLKMGLVYADLTSLFPNELRYYSSIEYNYNNLTPYVYYSNEKLYFKENVLASRYKELTESEKYSVGLRYDFSKNIAFKLSYSEHFNTTKYNDYSFDKDNQEILKGNINVLF